MEIIKKEWKKGEKENQKEKNKKRKGKETKKKLYKIEVQYLRQWPWEPNFKKRCSQL